MKVIIETTNLNEAKRLLKADDLAAFIWELEHNAWRKFKHTDYDYEKAWKVIRDLMEEYNINIHEIYE
jgi:hypothetical protein